MDNCQRCGGRLPWHSGVTTLMGGAHALLCVGCCNEWHTYFLALPEYEAIVALKVQELWLEGRAQARDAPSHAEWQTYCTTSEPLLARLFALGQAWLAAAPVPAP